MVEGAWARVYRWRDQPALPSSPPPGPLDIATWRLLWRVYAIRPSRVRMVAARLGLTGAAPVSLAQLARDHQLSRQRVRQICVQADRAARRVGPPEPLRPVVFRLETIGICYHDELVAEFLDEGLLAEPLRVESLAAVADLFGAPVAMPESLVVPGTRRILAQPRTAAEIRRWRSRLVVATMVAPLSLRDLPPPGGVRGDMIDLVVRADPRLQCSDDATFVWRADRLCTAADVCIRMLSAGPQTIAALLEGITRRYTNRYAVPQFNPPRADALTAYLSAQPWARLAGDEVSLGGPTPAPMAHRDQLFFDAVAGSRYPPARQLPPSRAQSTVPSQGAAPAPGASGSAGPVESDTVS
ncbi:MAG: hypothetical protein ACRDT6_19370 [Micromonosporaceae bacterium]